MLDHLTLKRYVTYDPETGFFFCRWANTHHKRGDKIGFTGEDGYVKVGVLGKQYFGHRLAWFYVHGEWPKHEIDHRNLVRSDNRIDNLREATDRQQAANRPVQKNSKSGLKGVSRLKSGRWQAKAYIQGKETYLGSFDAPEEAYATFAKLAIELYGEFARV